MAHVTDEQIGLYRAGALDATELLQVSDHLSECADCRTRVLAAGTLSASVAAIRNSLNAEEALRHLTYDQIAGFVDGELAGADADLVKAHARQCAPCAEDIRELQRLKTEIHARPNRGGFWRAFQGWRLAGAFVAVAAGVIAVTVVVHQRETKPAATAKVPGAASAVEISVPTTAAAAIRDGGRSITFSADGKVAGLDGLPDSLQQAVGQALTQHRVELPESIAQLSSKRDVLLGPSTAPRTVDLLQPIGTMVESQRPTFRWKSVPGAEYQVTVYDSEFQQVAASGWLHATEWQASTDLKRGIRYLWQLTVRSGGREFTAPEAPAPEAQFRVLDAATAADLASLKSTWRESHLVMGVAYARAGLLDDARQELQVAVDQNPQAPGLRALLDGVTHAGSVLK